MIQEGDRTRFGVSTHCGRIRQSNQDAYGHRGGLYLVADGMGGYRGGEVASRLAVEQMLAAFDASDPIAGLWRGFEAANRSIREEAEVNPDYAGMGTTMAVLLVLTDRAYLAHIGDSRIYRLHDETLTLLTRDHSLVEELVRQGNLTAEEARYHSRRNILTRALGTTELPEAEYSESDCSAGDRFLLCTDGLTTELTDDEIQSILGSGDEPQKLAERLIESANEHGGADNITVIVVACG